MSATDSLDLSAAGGLSFLLVGVGVTNAAVARALIDRGHAVAFVDDGAPGRPDEIAAEFGCVVERGLSEAALRERIESVDAVVPSPGLPERHPLFSIAANAGVPVLSEFDFAGAWDDRPVLAITGTNGKTTVTLLVEQMMLDSGISAVAVGNLEVPLVAAISDPEPKCFVVEASSFRLAQSRRFTPRVATWLNFAEDHLDVHLDMDRYRDAKARIWADQGPGDYAIVNAEDSVVAGLAPRTTGATVLRFGLVSKVDGLNVEYHERDGQLVGPDGLELVAVSDLWRTLPHDRSNALAAAATALAGGASVDGVRSALRAFRGLPHRVELVGESNGVRWYDDSKATAPHASRAALAGFDSVVLIAGGRNKGLDLSVMATGAINVRSVIGIGESAHDIVIAFGDVPGQVAASMSEAVTLANQVARSGDVVLLSPGCASFDWYESYAQRGDDFAQCVRQQLSEVTQ